MNTTSHHTNGTRSGPRACGQSRLAMVVLACLLASGVKAAEDAPHPAIRSANERDRSTVHVVTVGGDHDYPPYEFLDEEGEATGYNVELTKAIADVMGFDVRIRLGPWNDIRAALEAGEIDAVQGMFYSAERDKLVDFSVPYLVIHHAVFAREGSPGYASLASLVGQRVAVMRGDIMHDVAVEQGLVGKALLLTGTQEEALRMLAEGEVDFALCARLPGLYWAKEHAWDGIVVVDPHAHCPDYCHAVGEGDARLLSLFEEGIAVLRHSGEYRRIRDRWLGASEPVGVPWDRILMVGGTLALVLLALLIAAFVWSQSLRQRVKTRTHELEASVARQQQAEMALRDSRSQLQALFDNMIDGFAYHRIVTDADGLPVDYVFLEVNRAFEQLTGLKREETIGKRMTEITPDIRDMEFDWIGTYGEVALTGEPIRFEQYFSPHQHWYSVLAYCPAEGTFAVTFEEITARKQTEERLHLTQFAMDHATDAVYWMGPDACFVYVNEAACHALGYSRDELVGMTVHDIDPGFPKEVWPDHWETLRKYGSTIIQSCHRRKDGTTFPVEIALSYQRFGDQEYNIAFARDISEREAAADAVQESEERHRILFESSRDAIMTLEPPSWGFTSGNPACVEMFRCTDEADFTAHGPWDLSPEKQADGRPSGDKAKEMITRAMDEGSHFFEWAHQRADGEVFPATVLLTRVELEGGTFLQATVRDVSAQKQAEEAVRRAAEDWQNTFDSIDDYVAIIDLSHTVVRANQAMRDAYAGQEVVGARCHTLVHGTQKRPEGCVLCGVLEDGKPVHVELQEPNLGNRCFSVSAFPIRGGAGTVTHVVHVMRDITEHRLAEQREKELDGRLRQQQRLAAIGTLARGIAHEINNPIMGIVNYALLIKDGGIQEAEAQEFAAEIMSEGNRVADIVRTLLAFSVPNQQALPPAVRLADIVNGALGPMRGELEGDCISVRVDVPDGLSDVHCRKQQIQHALTNLLTNAREALNERYPESAPGKSITITAVEFEKAGRRWLRTTVEDQGGGIAKEAAERVFDPFFSTKDRSRSAGLGLAVVHWIVEDHDGEIAVESEPGGYSKFHLDLPVDSRIGLT
ncbi:MAG: transporter substrate-binding domain-containing protein [Lentisphaerae bacterium]|nr:transporter substrate-binding domain-containing protein [Lentisphaerota bacterium]MBT5604490.1 transporter substrate-binding domain-containing protein [Lentisphaerota bacterium]MBT7060491.1 transporter substrate-binding domain-containing protein [Lentisphaerota bacterium]MBT7844398.1 transporter substrate-binding domain-containing protein [Lentisphaerota bacterium]